MHSHKCANGAVIHYNADLSGDAHITCPLPAGDNPVGLGDRTASYVALTVPWADILALVQDVALGRLTTAVEDALERLREEG